MVNNIELGSREGLCLPENETINLQIRKMLAYIGLDVCQYLFCYFLNSMPSFIVRFSKALMTEFLLKRFMFSYHLWVVSILSFIVLIFLFEVFVGHTA